MSLKVAVITVSDRAAAGIYTDRSGPLAVELLQQAGFSCPGPTVVPDEAAALRSAINAARAAGARAIFTTGGTGVGPRDITPDVCAEIAPTEIPGITEEIRRLGTKNSPHALLSRARAGILDAPSAPQSESTAPLVGADQPTSPAGGSESRAVLVNAPGSPGGVRDTLAVLTPLLQHLVGQLDGQDHS